MFLHLPVSTMNEITGNKVSAYIVEWYKGQNPGDEIDFVSDTYDDWPFSHGNRENLQSYNEITEDVVSTLLKEGVIIDNGITWRDEDEPDKIFIRDLVLAKNTEQVN